MSNRPKAIIITGYGINCNHETAHAFEKSGADTEQLHLNDLIEDPAQLDHAQILAISGGFSFGDDIASGRVLANRLRYKLGDALQAFVAKGNLVIGICNGFQVLVKMGLLPAVGGTVKQELTLTHNDSARFEDRWVHLETDAQTNCVWTEGITAMELPIRHGEGKLVLGTEPDLAALQNAGCIALRYATSKGGLAQGEYPANPNGSTDDIAGICDPTGRVFGLMPHPEAFLHRTNHPRWTREELPEQGDGLALFQNAIKHTQLATH